MKNNSERDCFYSYEYLRKGVYMRKLININQGWLFTKDSSVLPVSLPTNWEEVNVPHSWNSVDGQDGGNDYYRGLCYYAKELKKSDLAEANRYYLEIQGANSEAVVYLNGKEITKHEGGYSTFRVELKDLQESNLLVVGVDNSPSKRVYPQTADFTFYGGLYRDVNVICVNDSHFDLDYYGGCGLQVTPVINGVNATVNLKSYVTNRKENQTVRYSIYDKEGNYLYTDRVNYGVEAPDGTSSFLTHIDALDRYFRYLNQTEYLSGLKSTKLADLLG